MGAVGLREKVFTCFNFRQLEAFRLLDLNVFYRSKHPSRHVARLDNPFRWMLTGTPVTLTTVTKLEPISTVRCGLESSAPGTITTHHRETSFLVRVGSEQTSDDKRFENARNQSSYISPTNIPTTGAVG